MLQQQQYCLRWKYHHSNLQTMFSNLLDRGCFCDVTLACEEKTIQAHRVVLCACSVYFDSILTKHAHEKNPIIIMKDARFNDIKCLVDFMYKGEINVEHDNLASLLKTAEELKIKGLAEVSWKTDRQREVQGHGQPPEGFDSNVYVKTFNNNNNISNAMPNTSSPNILMYPKINTPVSLAPDQFRAHPMQRMSPFHSMAMIPPQMVQQHQHLNSSNIPQLTPLRIQGTTTVQSESFNALPAKKKRGRPPLDGEFEHYTAQMSSTNPPATDPLFAPMADCTAPIMDRLEVSASAPPIEDLTDDPPGSDFLDIVKIEQPDTPEVSDYHEYDSDSNRHLTKKIKRRSRVKDHSYVDEDNESVVSEDKPSLDSSVILTSQELAEWSDVVKMNDYLKNGRRPQFWEESFTKRVLEAIKNKNLEMKKAAQVLGVSYGTLYGRYRETYGCLKHPYRGPFPKNMQNLWSKVEPNPNDLLSMLQHRAMTMKSSDPFEMVSSDFQMNHQSMQLQQQLQSQGVTLISE